MKNIPTGIRNHDLELRGDDALKGFLVGTAPVGGYAAN